MIAKNISEIEKIGRNTVTIRFSWDQEVQPGQFLMVWLPGHSEIPISVSHTGSMKGITIRSYGETSEAMIRLRKGEKIFFRGPYGRPFDVRPARKLIVGGGSGMAGLLPLIDSSAYGVVSARTSSDLLFADRFKEGHVTLVTDDGSAGIRGYAVDGVKSLRLDEFDMMYVCGPELMLKSILDYIADKPIPAQFSLERIMKCGIGVCDSCSIDGRQLCTEGPTFSKEELMGMHEFGVTRLTESGKRIQIGRH
ncbi:MAG: dihydroorotate dehydrogenase electron transfer subunit [Thermoplasmataceae archaeon]